MSPRVSETNVERPEPFALRKALSRRGALAAFKARKRIGLPLNQAISVFDAAEMSGLEVRFHAIASMEGMYVRSGLAGNAPHVVVSSLRPVGRQSMTAAHEWGHHVFDHGSRVDEYLLGLERLAIRDEFKEEEYLVDSFAAFMIMPPRAVEKGFSARGFDIATPSARQVYEVAGWLGVGYSALVYHLGHSLRRISLAQESTLRRVQPREIRARLCDGPGAGDVYVVNRCWTGRPVDLMVGDTALVPRGTSVETTSGATATADSGPVLVEHGPVATVVVRAISPGIGRIVGPDFAAFVRVSERGYVGRNTFRHLPRADDALPVSSVL